MANVLAKTVTDPYNNAWYYSGGSLFIENADQCSKYFTSAYYNGASYYNMYVGGRYYLVQSNWNLRLGACTMYY